VVLSDVTNWGGCDSKNRVLGLLLRLWHKGQDSVSQRRILRLKNTEMDLEGIGCQFVKCI